MPNRYPIVGTQFTGVPESFVASLKAGSPAVLVREPDNPHDPNAVAVYVEDLKIGYVPKKQNAVLAQFIDQQGRDQIISGHHRAAAACSLGMDAADKLATNKAIDATFVRSPNSGFPMVEV